DLRPLQLVAEHSFHLGSRHVAHAVVYLSHPGGRHTIPVFFCLSHRGGACDLRASTALTLRHESLDSASANLAPSRASLFSFLDLQGHGVYSGVPSEQP